MATVAIPPVPSPRGGVLPRGRGKGCAGPGCVPRRGCGKIARATQGERGSRARRVGFLSPATSRIKIRCEALKGEKRTVPIFPLGLVPVLFSSIPLHIFEARYRVLFNTLLAGEKAIDEGLVNHELDYVGTKQFGLCYVDKEGNIASVGALLEIEQHQQLEDGRLFVQSTSIQRFKVLDVVEQRPVLVCEVEFLEETDVEDDGEIKALASDVGDLFMKTLKLGLSIDGVAEPEVPEQMTLPPTQFSYWLATLFPKDPDQQQMLLQIDSTKDRLEREKEIFQATYNYHLARSSIKSAFNDTSTSEGSD